MNYMLMTYWPVKLQKVAFQLILFLIFIHFIRDLIISNTKSTEHYNIIQIFMCKFRLNGGLFL